MCLGKGWLGVHSLWRPCYICKHILRPQPGLDEDCKNEIKRLALSCQAGSRMAGFDTLCVRHEWLVQLTCQQGSGRPGAMYGNGAAWPPQAVEPAESLCKACNVSRYTFEPPSIFCTSCQQRIKRNQVRPSAAAFPLTP